MNYFSGLADVVVIFHGAYVAFVLLGLVAILAGYILRWNWIRNWWFRGTHLTMILVVVVEAFAGVTCPLTTLEKYLRLQAGTTVREGTFLGQIVHDWLFYDVEPWVLTAAYSLFGLLVLATWMIIPPRRLALPVTSKRDK